ncbi:unnamed protein product [Dicrocoelium dendriticum]|nr:unnamed protein product [Dicrocoelium dendriticum]
MNQYIIPLPHNDPTLFSHASHAFSLVDLGKRLLEAAKNGDVDELKSLMNSGAPFTTDWLGISPLHFAAMNGHFSSCEALLCAGISRDARTKVDRTPLHLAAQEGHADIVELLLRSGADIGAKDMLQMTALHWAAERGHTPVVQMLMRFGADAHVQNKFEMTPLDIADFKGHFDARDAMLNTRDDMVSVVGHIDTTSGDLVDTNAYILTEEETLVPAAPPAGEVIVTATTVDETTDDAQNNGIMDRCNRAHEHPSPTRDAVSLTSTWDRGPQSPSLHCVAVPGLGSPADKMLPEHCVDFQLRTNHESTTAMPHVDPNVIPSDEIVPQCDNDDFGPVIMLIRTPNGETLHVRQMDDAFYPENLAIFTIAGERVHSSHLMAQVIESLSDLPRDDGSESPHADPAITSSDHADVASSGVTETQNSTKSGRSVSPNDETTADLVNTSHPQFVGRANGLEEEFAEEDTSTLLVQLASFIEAAESRNESFCVNDVGPGASVEEFCDWCLCNGIFVQSLDTGSNFVVNFIHDRKAYSLNVSYDPESGSTRFSLPRDRKSSCE